VYSFLFFLLFWYLSKVLSILISSSSMFFVEANIYVKRPCHSLNSSTHRVLPVVETCAFRYVCQEFVWKIVYGA